MKFRVTPSAFIASILILVLLAGFLVVFAMGDFLSGYVDSLLSGIKLPASISVSFSSMDRQFLHHVEFRDLTVKYKGETLFYSDSIELSASIPALISHYLSGSSIFDLRVNQPVITVNQTQFDELAAEITALNSSSAEKEEAVIPEAVGSQVNLDLSASNPYQAYQKAEAERIAREAETVRQDSSEIMDSLVDRTGLRIWLTDGTISLRLFGISAECTGLDSAFSFFPGFIYNSANINITNSLFSYEDIQAQFDDIKTSFDNNSVLQLSFENLDTPFGTVRNGFLETTVKFAEDGSLGVLPVTLITREINSELNGQKISLQSMEDTGTIDTGDFSHDLNIAMTGVAYNGPLGNAGIQTLDLQTSGNYAKDINLDLVLQGLSGNYPAEGISGIISTVSLTGDVEMDTRKATGVLLLNSLSLGGLERFLLENTLIPELSLNFNLSPELMMGDFYASLDTDVADSLIGHAQSRILADFQYESADSFHANVKLDQTRLETIPDDIVLDLSLSRELGKDLLAEGQMTLGTNVRVLGNGNLTTREVSASVRLENLLPSHYDFFYRTYEKEIGAYIKDDTNLDLFLSLNILDFRKMDLDFNLDLAVRQVAFGKSRYNFTVSLNSLIQDNILQVRKFTASTDLYRLDYDGRINSNLLRRGGTLAGNLPEGTLSLSRTRDGTELGSLQLASVSSNLYNFLVLIPSLTGFSFGGEMSIGEASDIALDSDLTFDTVSYPLDVDLDFLSGRYLITSTGLSLLGTYRENTISLGIDLDDFELRLPGGLEYWMNMSTEGFYNIQSQDFRLDVDSFRMRKAFSSTIYGFDLAFNPGELSLTDLSIGFSDGTSVSGQLEFLFDDFLSLFKGKTDNLSAMLKLESSRGETLDAAYLKKRISFSLGNLDLSRFGLEALFNLSLLGRLDGDAYGSLSFRQGESTLTSDLVSTPEIVQMKNFESTFDSIDLAGSGISIDRRTNLVDARLNGKMTLDFKSGPMVYQIQSSLDFDYLPISTMVGEVIRTIRENPLGLFTTAFDFQGVAENLKADLHLDRLVFGDFPMQPDDVLIGFTDGVISADGKFISASFDTRSSKVFLDINKDWGIGLSADGIMDGKTINVDVSSLFIPLKLINVFVDMVSVPFQGGEATGSFRILKDSSSDLGLYGTLYANNVSARVFWVPDTEFRVSNAIISLDGLQFHSPKQRLEILSLEDNTRGYGTFSAMADLSSGFIYDLDIDLQDATMPLWVPVPAVRLDFHADIGGTTHIGSDGTGYLKGNVTSSNMMADFNLDLATVPQWYLENDVPTDYDFTVTFLKNNVFAYPSSENPILDVTINEGDTIRAGYYTSARDFFVEGDVSLQSGQIYYFQKDFVVTEGKLSFNRDYLNSNGALQIGLDLRARMRDYDQNGNKVDIYLNLQNSSLDSIEPFFTSVPSLPENEILELLGQSILPSSAFQAPSLSSVASLTVAAAEAIGKLGIIQTGQASLGLQSIIGQSLGLDVFSIRTSLLQNIVIDALPGSVFSSDLSSIAKYLDGTSIYVGKNITEDLFLQGTISLKADPDAGNNAAFGGFLSNDLRLDLEFSLDWDTPLAVFSFFTQPQELSIFNLFDTMGFSVTKSIEF